jgi:cysteine synthase
VLFDDVIQAIGQTPLVGLPRLSPPGYRIYLKLGVSTRAEASLYAMRHGLVE